MSLKSNMVDLVGSGRLRQILENGDISSSEIQYIVDAVKEKNQPKPVKTIKSLCKNCGLNIISNDKGKTWAHGIILDDGRPWITPINGTCNKPEKI